MNNKEKQYVEKLEEVVDYFFRHESSQRISNYQNELSQLKFEIKERSIKDESYPKIVNMVNYLFTNAIRHLTNDELKILSDSILERLHKEEKEQRGTAEEYLKTKGIYSLETTKHYNEVIQWMEGYADFRNSGRDERFTFPTDKQVIEIAILFNDGKIDHKKLSDKVAMSTFIIDRLYENGDILKPSSKEVK